MWRFLTDEDMSRSTAVMLRSAGYGAEDVRDVGLRGHSDADVFAYAQTQNATLISADKGFTNLLLFPLGTHAGIIVVRIPDEVPPKRLNEELLRTLATLADQSLSGLLIIVEIGRIRIRRPTSAMQN
jgi:predicted nuclease of predicted toxin-antitoxin system